MNLMKNTAFLLLGFGMTIPANAANCIAEFQRIVWMDLLREGRLTPLHTPYDDTHITKEAVELKEKIDKQKKALVLAERSVYSGGFSDGYYENDDADVIKSSRILEHLNKQFDTLIALQKRNYQFCTEFRLKP